MMRAVVRCIVWGLAGLLLAGWGPARAEGTSLWLEAARREASVVVYAALDRAAAQPLIDDFQALYPGVRVDYAELNSADLDQRFRAEAGRGPSADVLWSPAMDLQIKLANDGYAQPHHSAETAALPPWAVWKEEAFGTTFEPVALIYNTRLLAPPEVPVTHAQLLRLLTQQRARFTGRVTTFDPERSGVGFLLQTQDVQANPVVFWSLAQALGEADVVRLPNTADMLGRVAAGDVVLGYNVLGTYALTRSGGDPRIGVVLLQDYTLVLSRVVLIARQARHPNAARLWVDYLLSRRGQDVLAHHTGIFSVREDVHGDSATSELRTRLGAAARPIALGTGLLTYLDQLKRRDFLRRWQAVTEGP